MLVCLLLLAIPAGGDASQLLAADGKLTRLPGLGETRQWLGYLGSMAVLLLLGVFTGLFAVPLQVFMQYRPPEDKKGRMIAVMNQANWIGIFIAGGIYDLLASLIEWRDWPRVTMFLFIALFMLPIAMFYHPKNEELARSKCPVVATPGLCEVVQFAASVADVASSLNTCVFAATTCWCCPRSIASW